MQQIQGFISYSHKDNSHHFIESLKNELCAEFNIITGDELQIFIDKDDLQWGDHWENKIENGILTANFFIPIISQNYFKSESCVQELRLFFANTGEDTARQLILPIKYTDIDENDLTTNSDLLSKVFSYQYEDWSLTRFCSPGEKEYRLAIHKMALRLRNANRVLLERLTNDTSPNVNSCPNITTKELPGKEADNNYFYLECIDEVPEWSFKLTEELNALSEETNNLTAVANDGTRQLDSLGTNKNSKNILNITANMGSRLNGIADHFDQHSQACANLIYDFDPKMNCIIEYFSQNENKESIEASKQILTMADATKESMAKFDKLEQVLEKTERISRPLYKPLRKIRESLLVCNGAFKLVVGWGEKIAR